MSRPRTLAVAGVSALLAVLFFACGPEWSGETIEKAEEQAPPKVDKSTMKNPWARAKVGDWYMVRGGGATRQIKIEVVKVTDVEVQVQVGDGDDAYFEVYNLQEEESKYVDPESYPDVKSVEEQVIDVGGKPLTCRVVTRENENGKLVNTYSRDLPLDGIVRSVRDGKIGQDVIDFHKN